MSHENIRIIYSPCLQTEEAARILRKQLKRRCVCPGQKAYTIHLGLDNGIGREGYRIEAREDGLHVFGNDALGLIYGVGKLLHDANWDQGMFIAGSFTGSSVPEKDFRGMYLATHFHNFYHDAPLGEVQDYLEDVILWGMNTLVVWFDMHHYPSIDDPDAREMLGRLHSILQSVKKMGMRTALMVLGNEAFADSPQNMRADWTAGHDGYTHQLSGHYHVELCPSKPGGAALLMQWREQVFHAFEDIGMDYIITFPYDQGGCTCGACKPWGANGFFRLAGGIAKLGRRIWPQVKVIFSTWLFDHFTKGEWEGLEKALEVDSDWVDYLLFDGRADGDYPECFAQKTGLGSIPLLSFPEISMFDAVPWGGFGINPGAVRLQETWDRLKDILEGGFPYSEGIYEDLNKAIFSQFYWDANRKAKDTMREYIAYEFSAEYADEILAVLEKMEKTLLRHRYDEEGKEHDYPNFAIPWIGQQRFVLSNTDDVDEIYGCVLVLDKKLPEMVKRQWRWRIIYLRGVIDYELLHNNFCSTDAAEAAFEELVGIYHAQNADYCISPPTKEAIEVNRGNFG